MTSSQSKVGQLAKKVLFFAKDSSSSSSSKADPAAAPGDDAGAAGGAAAGAAAAPGPVTPKAAAAAGAWHSPRSGSSGSGARGLSGSLARRSMGSLNLGEFKVRIGVCAMDKKANSKPMREIVSRLVAYGEFEVVTFGDELILNAPISEWPRVDCLMSWYSDGFPLAKAQAYADATRPFLINDLHMQDALQDRRLVYKVLQDAGIAVPHHIIVSREGLAEDEDPPGFLEEEDWVEMDGVRINKPFVEKPASGEDHNIHVYYPHSMGGGVKRLFRKVDNKSSCYDPHHPGTVRRTGSFIYEEFLATGGTDVKVYTLGPRYAHAEARKSPVVDGRVLRTADGKEMRFPVLLNPAEKEISRTVCLAFSQKVCGFDLLRSEKGRSYVCDVNGWSFVKNSRKYYDDAAGILRSTILSALAPHRLALGPGPAGGPLSFSLASLSPLAQQSLAAAGGADGAAGREQLSPAAAAAVIAAGGFAEEAPYLAKTASMAELSSLVAELSGVDLMEATKTDERSSREELRCVLAVIRHGDRTPKQKLKVRVRQPALLALFSKHADSKGKQAKLKSPSQLQELLDISRSLLQELERSPPPGLSEEELESREEQREKLRIVKTVLEQGGQFSGINRKVQLKPLTWSTPATANPADGASSGQPSEQQEQQAEEAPVLQEVLLILKYGGVLTHAGRAQAEELGKVFRLVMYPRYGSTGGGLLRLHSTYRHDLKIYSSDEGRVQVSAAAFTKGLLDLEGSSLTPILVSLVTKDASMLDAFGKGASEDIRRAKNILYSAMTWDPDTASSVRFEPNYSRSTTPLLTSPPMSPRTISRASSSGGGGGGSSNGNAAKPPLAAGSGAAGSAAAAADKQLDAAATVAAAAAVAAGVSQDGSGGGGNTAALPAAVGAPAGGGSGGGGHVIQSMPTNPLQHLRRLNDLMKLMVEQLRELVLAEKRHGISTTASSSARDLLQAGSSAAAAAAASAVPAAAGDRSASISLSAPPPMDAGSSSIGGSLLLGSSGSGSGRRGSSSGCAGAPATPAAGGTAGPSGGALQSPQRPSTAPPAGRRSRDGGSRDGSGGGSSCSAAAVASSKYSSLSCDPSDWQLEADKPCSGERLLLMFDRWQKLAKSFYKKGRFDISKVPDIYDSAKYDALHNSHLLGSVLADLYQEAKILADAVIPNEYGIDPASKLAIGSKIATELLAKLLDDLRASKEESLATLTDAERSASAGPAGSEGSGSSMRQQQQGHDRPLGRKSMPHLAPGDSSSSMSRSSAHPPVSRAASAGAALLAAAAAAKEAAAGAGGEASEEGAAVDGDEDFSSEPEFMHRLCPMYASDINSPLRHVRTRIYFTSESHMHSLVNLLKFCHLRHTLLPPTGNRDSGNSRSSLDVPRSSFDFSRSVSDDAAPARGSQLAAAAGGSGSSAANPASQQQQQQSIPGSPGSGSSSLQPQASQQMGAAAAAAAAESLLSEEAMEMLATTTELDYLTHLVFRLYENTSVTADHPQRFRLEILFTPGTAWDPTKVIPPKGNHTLSPKPRGDLLRADGVTLADFEKQLRPFAKRKGPPPATGSGGKPAA